MGCPSDDTLAAYVARELDEDRRMVIERHVERCEPCREALAHFVDAFASSMAHAAMERTDAPQAPSRPLSRGMAVGRYLIVEPLGAGAMGEVFAAYDPELDRRVAVKLLHSSLLGAQRDDWTSRFQREARAMASLSHPNIVPVHDVGTHDGDVFFAMELVEGQTLGQWLRQRQRSVREILTAFVAAGLGLSAAHRHGVVHRDFKPDNVLVGRDGQVRVSDFGLARFADDPGGGAPRAAEDRSDTEADVRTRPGALIGTPAYMALEQLEGRPADARSDQFSFCVALFEALYEKRPFRGSTVAALLADMEQAKPSRRIGNAAVPGRVRRAIVRGLELDPDRRHASMAALLAELGERPWARLAWPTAVGLSALGFGLTAQALSDDGAVACPSGQGELVAIWDDVRRDAVQRAFETSEQPFAAAAWARTSVAVDDYADRWAAQRTDACEATMVRADQSPALMDLRIACLRRARASLLATVDALETATPMVIERAGDLVDGLMPLQACADLEALQDKSASPDEAIADAVEQARLRLTEIHTKLRVGGFRDALAQAETVREQVRDLDYDPLQAEVLYAVARARGRVDESAQEQLQQALRLALASEQWVTAARAAIVLTCSGPGDRAGVQTRLAYAQVARGLVGRPEVDVYDRAHAGYCRAAALDDAGQSEAAQAQAAEVVQMLTTEVGEGHEWTAKAHRRLGETLRSQGRHTEAEAEFRAAVSSLEGILGPQHPDVARARVQLASVLQIQGRRDDVEREYRAALAIWERAVGPHSKFVASARGALGTLYYEQDRYADAEVEFRKALDAFAAAQGPDEPEVIQTVANLGFALTELERWPEAEAQLRDAMARATRGMGPNHPMTIKLLGDLGNYLRRRGQLAEAEQVLGQAVEAASGRASTPPVLTAVATFALARVVWQRRRDRTRAIGLATEAVAAFEAAGPGFEQRGAEANAWLARLHRGQSPQ